jgi:hypothetical protein
MKLRLQEPKTSRREQRPEVSSQQAACLESPHWASRTVLLDRAAKPLAMSREIATKAFIFAVLGVDTINFVYIKASLLLGSEEAGSD